MKGATSVLLDVKGLNVDIVHKPSECLFINILVFNILSSKRDLNKRQSIHSVRVFNKPIYRYTYQTRINKSKSAMTNEIFYYLSKKKRVNRYTLL